MGRKIRWKRCSENGFESSYRGFKLYCIGGTGEKWTCWVYERLRWWERLLRVGLSNDSLTMVSHNIRDSMDQMVMDFIDEYVEL